jgi:hypothetical protein
MAGDRNITMRVSDYPQTGTAWAELYRAAIFEHDQLNLQTRISDAEQALVLRARELFNLSGDHIEEQEALDDAMYALHALRSTLHYKSQGQTQRPDLQDCPTDTKVA